MSSCREYKDNMSEMTSSSSMNNKKHLMPTFSKEDINYFENFNPLMPDETLLYPPNNNAKKSNLFYSNLNTFKKDIKHFSHNNLDDNMENDSDCYFKEAKRRLSFQSSFNFSFNNNNNNKFSFSDEETENLKLFSAENSNLIPFKKSLSERLIPKLEDKKPKTIFKSFTFKKVDLSKPEINSNFSSSSNNINKLKSKKLFLINNAVIKKKPLLKTKTLEKKKFKFVTQSVSLF